MRYGHILLLIVGLTIANDIDAAEIVRRYTMGEDDANPIPAIGTDADGTVDTLEFPDDDPDNADAEGQLVDLLGVDFGTYVEGRSGPDSRAVEFDGADYFESPRFDPRDFGTFAALSQGWFKPDSESLGTRQGLWAVGADNGGVAISEEGFYELVAGGNAGTTVTETMAKFDEWTHLAVFRGGNGASLYVDGALVDTAEGFWNGPGTFILGGDSQGIDLFDGAIDDFTLSGFGDGDFTIANDLTFFEELELSGVPGDVDQDGLVNDRDYEIWVANAGFDNGLGAGDVVTLLNGDLDQNGQVNFSDFSIIRTEAAAGGVMLNAVPEPASGMLLTMAVLSMGLLRRPRRNH